MSTENSTGFIRFLMKELKPRGKVLTPFNVLALLTVIAAVVILYIRFTQGLGSVGHASQDHPWGLWINFNVITGVAFAGGAYVVTFMFYILGQKKYQPIVRATVLYALLAYMFYAGALLLDLGRPWKVVNPIIGNSFGISSVLFLVAWHFILYMISLFIEFSPAVTEWARLKKTRKVAVSFTLGVVIFGIALSTLHQSGLGALFLMAKPKIHPLWYSEFIPILFFISSIFAGLSLVIILETIAQKAFRKEMSPKYKKAHKGISVSLARTCSMAIFVYLSMVILVFIHGKDYAYLNSGWGRWFMVEILGFVFIPGVLFTYAWRRNNLNVVRIAAVLTIIGIILNRLNISTFTYLWYDNEIFFPTWQEIVVCVAVIFVQVLVFRWIVRRMPVYSEPPAWASIKRKKETVIYEEEKVMYN